MPNIHHEVLIAAATEKIYHAITSREGLSGWWAPGTSAKAEAGSVVHLPFGPGYYKEMNIIQATPGQRVKWACIAGADEWVGTTLTFTLAGGDIHSLQNDHTEIGGQADQLTDTGKATLLTFHHDGWKAYTAMFAECSYTWGQFLRSLKLWCETGKGRPYPNQHRINL